MGIFLRFVFKCHPYLEILKLEIFMKDLQTFELLIYSEIITSLKEIFLSIFEGT